jgi:uroporphyrinogen decarboxylase
MGANQRKTDMTQLNVPLAHPKPDYREFIKAVTTSYVPARPRLVEYLFNGPIQNAVFEMLGRPQGGGDVYWDNYIALWYHLGYDFVRLEMSLNFPRPSREGGDHGRSYSETAHGSIESWEDFEKYPWPTAKDEDFAAYEYVAAHMPDGMGLITCHAGGPLEHLTGLMGYEPLCIALYEQPDLVRAVIDRIEQCVTPYVQRLLKLPRMIAYFQGDDMGFRTGPLLGPDHLRKYTLPVHKRFAALTHAAGLPYFLHSCGRTEDIMPDLIDDVKIDGKHSVEDAIMPVQEWKRRYGDRIGIIGGVDVDKLCRSTPTELRRYVRKIIDDCAPGGHFVIGSGSSIADYVPVENLLTMLDEAMKT